MSDKKTEFEWIGQMLPTNGWIVFVLKSTSAPRIRSIVTKHHGRYVAKGRAIRGTG